MIFYKCPFKKTIAEEKKQAREKLKLAQSQVSQNNNPDEIISLTDQIHPCSWLKICCDAFLTEQPYIL